MIVEDVVEEGVERMADEEAVVDEDGVELPSLKERYFLRLEPNNKRGLPRNVYRPRRGCKIEKSILRKKWSVSWIPLLGRRPENNPTGARRVSWIPWTMKKWTNMPNHNQDVEEKGPRWRAYFMIRTLVKKKNAISDG
jgi:hypothetical protein